MAGTQADMKSRIALELVRSDLTAQIANAITDAIIAYQRERFRFMEPEILLEPSFSTTPGLMTYDSATPLTGMVYPFLNATIGNLFTIDYLTFLVAGIVFQVTRNDELAIKIANQQGLMQGMPQEFCYVGNAITLYPVPNQVWVMQIMGQLVVSAPASDTEVSNPWMTVAERLIRSRAKFEICKHVTRNATMAQMMSPDPPHLNGGVTGETYRAYQELKRETNRIKSRGRITPMAM